MTTLYHGSYVSVPAPLTGVGRKELDFGPGFYVDSCLHYVGTEPVAEKGGQG